MHRPHLSWVMLIVICVGGCTNLRHPAFVEPIDDVDTDVLSDQQPTNADEPTEPADDNP